jgi:hypothetical protein
MWRVEAIRNRIKIGPILRPTPHLRMIIKVVKIRELRRARVPSINLSHIGVLIL